MSNIKEYKNIIAFPPGYYIEEIIDDMGITQEEFAIRLGTTPKTISKLVNGEINLSNDLIQKLSTMFEMGVDIWLNLRQKYEEKTIEIKNQRSIDEQKEVMNLIDYSFFTKVAGLPKASKIEEKIQRLCVYLKISDLRILLRPDFLANFRSGVSNIQEKNEINSRAWLITAMNMARERNVNPFNSEKLKNFLPDIRQMTTQPPPVFLPHLREIFSECGVVFVLLPHLKNSGINGVVRWYGRDKVLLALNDRRCYADTFWFSLFHEIKHILQQKVKLTFLSGIDVGMVDTILEQDADKFAREYLIPESLYQKIQHCSLSENAIKKFAAELGIHPGILVGRLQHDKVISPAHFNNLRQKYKIVV